MAKKKKSLFSKIIVVSVIVLNVIFTAVVLGIFLKTSVEPSSLVVAWFSFTTVELWSLAGIKKAKSRKDDDYDC
jgi:pheromone shutdown protein TraB